MNLLNDCRTSDYEYYKRDGEAEERARRIIATETVPAVAVECAAGCQATRIVPCKIGK